MTTQWNKDETKDSVLTENTAQAVFKYLTDQESNRATMRTRWIWELLQNARDASTGTNNHLVAEVEYSEEKLIFSHNGSGFKEKQIAHLIFHGSTKMEEEETIGQYGSGFLTTHLLSSEIDISGQLDDDQWFDFRLARRPDSVGALRESMDEAWENFNPSQHPQFPMPAPFTTRFVYPIVGDDSTDAVEKGIRTLKQCAPFVVVFNQEFSRINIKTSGETRCFEVVERQSLDVPGIQQITVLETTDENCTKIEYLLAQGEKALVALPLKLTGSKLVCQSVKDIPRLFLGFPLVGTEDFSFPAVINSLVFTPTENRDGVYLGQSDNKANRNNQTIIEEACELLVCLVQFAASKGWYHAHRWVEVPSVENQTWLNAGWLRKCIRESLIKEIRETPTVLTEAGNAIASKEAMLPLVEDEEGVETLWDLLVDWQGYHEKLPRRDEAIGWCAAIKSWTDVYGPTISTFYEAIDGSKLALWTENKCSGSNNFQNLLEENVCAVNWLNRFYKFLMDKGFGDEIRKRRFILDQAGGFHQFSNLHRDIDIADELKDIAKLLGWSIHSQLRNARLTTLDAEQGPDGWNSKYVTDDLVSRLRRRAEQNQDDNFKKASKHLFAWIVHQKDYSRLSDFPVFAEETDSEESTIIHLPHPTSDNIENNERPLAPVLSWVDDLQPYSELFPRRHILANAFFDAVPHPDIWQTLEDRGFIRKNVIITTRRNASFNALLPEDPLTENEDHNSLEPIFVTNVAFLTKDDIGIMARVRQSQRLARIFWSFLTEWLIVHDSKGLEINNEELCTCKERHRYYSAEWLVPIVRNRWVPLGERKSNQVTAESLANLLRGSEWDPGFLSENHPVVRLLEAINVARFDLMRQTATENEDNRVAVDNAFIEMLAKTKGDVKDLNHAIKYVEALKDDEDLPNIIAKHQDRKRTIKENKDFGDQVEKIVGKILKSEGYSVEDVHKGADFRISGSTEDSEDIDTLTTLAVTDLTCGREWLIEVKSARTESVKMSFAQADTAVEHGENFLLCVVPIRSEDTELNLEEKNAIIRENMKFITNIGVLIAPLLEDLNALEDLRTDTTTDNGAGVRLVYETGATGIRVNRSLWEDEKVGFPLKKLAENLK